MAVQIISDIHLETYTDGYHSFQITPRAPILALLGDIGNVEPHRVSLAAFLNTQLRQFHAVLFIPGNHEAYHSTWPATLQILQSFEQEVTARRTAGESALGELVILDRRGYRVAANTAGNNSARDVILLGCSLFSHIPPEQEELVGQLMNDYRMTGDRWDVYWHKQMHARDVGWLNEAVLSLTAPPTNQPASAPEPAIIILTHWSPTTDGRGRSPKYGDFASDPIGSAFSTDLSDQICFQSPLVKAWAFGHTHFNCDFTVPRPRAEPLRVVTNQGGYEFAPAAGFTNDKVIQV